jgi:hypothetical protein
MKKCETHYAFSVLMFFEIHLLKAVCAVRMVIATSTVTFKSVVRLSAFVEVEIFIFGAVPQLRD